MKRHLLLLFVLVLSGISKTAYSQDIHFSQFYETAILRNPALTGIFSGDYKVGVNYRTQWSNISVPFQTILVSGETRFAINKEVGDYISVGLVSTYDKAGSISFNSLQVYPAINYNKALEDARQSYLSVGFAGGYIQRSIDFSKATFASQYVNGTYDPGTQSGEQLNTTKVQSYDLAAGVSFNSSAGQENNINYYVGAAAFHIIQPNQSFNNEAFINLDMKWSGNFGLRWNITPTYAFTAHTNYTRQGPYQEILAGGLVSYTALDANQQKSFFTLYAGLFVRYKDAYIPTMKLDYDRYSVTLSYDINTSSLQPATSGAGGFEISLFMRGNYKKNQLGQDAVRCPRFEMMMPTF